MAAAAEIREKRTDWTCTNDASSCSAELDAAEARAMLSEIRGTRLGPGGEWDDEARARFAEFQKSEGLPPTGELDDISVSRLKRRFEQVVAEREATGPKEAIESPTVAAHGRVSHALQEAIHAVENLAHQFGHDSPIREQYVREAKAWAQTILQQFREGKITEGEAAYMASSLRNSALREARSGLSPAGAALSKFLKEEGVTLAVLTEKYAVKMFGKSFKELTAAERNLVCVKIAEKAGITNSVVNNASRLAPYAGKALTAVAIAVAFYQVANAEDKVGEAVKQGAGFLGFWAGAKVGGTIGTAVCGPPCGVIGGLALGILGSLLAESAAEHGYHRIKG